MARICRTLSDTGFEVEIIGRKRKKSIQLQTKKYKQIRLNCFFEKGKLFYIEYNFYLFLYLLFKKCDIISSVDLDTILPCTLISKIRSKKLVFDAHEYFTEVPEVTNRKIVKGIWEIVAKGCIPQANKAYTVGESLAEIFIKKYKKDFSVIQNVPNLNDKKNFKHQIPNSKPIILYQGALNEGRGIEETIGTMKNIDAEFWIAGEGDLSGIVRKKVLENNLSDKIKFLGYVSPDDLKAITQKATVGINVLQNKGLSYYYSLSNKFFDYMHAGIPQVCASFPEYQKINDTFEIALLCECNENAIFESINQLLKDKSLYENLQSNCLKAALVYNWKNEEQKLILIYKNV